MLDNLSIIKEIALTGRSVASEKTGSAKPILSFVFFVFTFVSFVVKQN